MSKTVKKYRHKGGIITELDLQEEKIKAEKMLKIQKAKKQGRYCPMSLWRRWH